jgi:23S rRNA pseudouridine1911/1915/1917 synthase
VSPARHLPVPDGLVGERVDAALARALGLARARVQAILDAGGVRIGGEPVTKSRRLQAGDLIDIDLADPAPAAPAGPPPQPVPGFSIVWEDPDLVVVDKPPGVAAHPSPGWTGPTVLGALAAIGRLPAPAGPPERHGIVHRLDAGTSGLMVVAKSVPAYSGLKRAFKERSVVKTYHALVQGHPDPLVGTIDGPIGRHPGGVYKFAVTARGKPAITHYEVIEAFRGASLVEVHLETGRTHQIRVHFAAIGHPVAGDPLYGSDPVMAARLGLERQWLHAARLGFTHPVTGRPVEVSSPYAPDLERALEIMREESEER